MIVEVLIAIGVVPVCLLFLGLTKAYISMESFLSAILALAIMEFIRFRFIEIPGFKETLYRVTHLRPIKFISMGDRELSIEDVFFQLTKHSKRDIAFDFAIESLKQIGERTGFARVRIGVEEYVEFLQTICSRTEESITATCKVRPFWFLTETAHGEHLMPFKSAQCKTKIRLVILDIEEIIGIVEDSLRNLTVINGPGVKSKEYYELPEIQFFIEEVNNVPKNFRVYWALEEKLTQGKFFEDFFKQISTLRVIPDYAVFDQDIVLRFEFINEMTGKGDMFLEWGADVVQNYKSVFATLEQKEVKIPKSLSEWFATETPVGLRECKIFRSFKELLSEVDSTRPIDLSSVDNDVKKKLSEGIHLNINDKKSNLESFVKIYNALLDRLTKGVLGIKKEIRVKGLKGTIRWRENWNYLLKKRRR